MNRRLRGGGFKREKAHLSDAAADLRRRKPLRAAARWHSVRGGGRSSEDEAV